MSANVMLFHAKPENGDSLYGLFLIANTGLCYLLWIK